MASDVLLECACCSGDKDLHAESSATWMFLMLSGLKCLTSAAMTVPKEAIERDIVAICLALTRVGFADARLLWSLEWLQIFGNDLHRRYGRVA